jgi:uncharacterized protein (DUF39 family)
MDLALRTITAINRRIRNGSSVVWTASKLLEHKRATPDEVDIVAIAFESSLSGTAAMLCVPVAERGVFTRAESIWLNGLEGRPGPAPNERLGIVDTMIFAGTQREEAGSLYSGGRLLFDLIRGNEINVECLAVEGSRHAAKVRLADLEFARFYVYNAFVGHALPESVLNALGRGSRILLNGAQGIIVGCGTRDDGLHRSWSLAANMQTMDPALIKDPNDAGADDLKNMIAVAIPILNQAIFTDLLEWTALRPQANPREMSACQQVRDKIFDGMLTLTDTDYAI